MTTDIQGLIANLPLKEQDSSLLSYEIINRAQALEPFEFGDAMDKVHKAIQTAAFLHRKATRANRGVMPRTHYIEHPLRNAVRLLRYGVTYPSVITATILHDTLEDCAMEINHLLFGIPDTGDYTAIGHRRFARAYLNNEFGYNVGYLIEAVSNPIWESGISKAEKRVAYAEHVTEAVSEADVYLIKFSDWVDNAVGLRHNATKGNEGMVAHLAEKYLPLADIFTQNLTPEVESLVSPDGVIQMRDHIANGTAHLKALLVT